MTRRIRLSNGKYTLVSDHRYEELRKYHWGDNGHGYVVRNYGPYVNGRHVVIKMHRQILGLTKGDGIHTDHINGNRRDNRDENLRRATKKDNSHNHRKYPNNKTGYKGVSWLESSHCYLASLKMGKKTYYLGHYLDPKVAAHAYDNKARELFGEFACTNFSDVIPDSELLRLRRPDGRRRENRK